jgi:hypothetical protein
MSLTSKIKFYKVNLIVNGQLTKELTIKEVNGKKTIYRVNSIGTDDWGGTPGAMVQAA